MSPPLEPDALHALAFQASAVPHVGSDGPDGHFLGQLRGRDYATGVNAMTGMRRFEARSRYCVQPG